MSGVVGHSLYALLAMEAAGARGNPITPTLRRNRASYVAGAYLGCDIQTLPASQGLRTGRESGYAKLPTGVTELYGEPVRQWRIEHQRERFTPGDVHRIFYGRAHLILGWAPGDIGHGVPSDHLPDYFAAVVDDAVGLFGPGERQLAYLFGWMCHVVGDALIKSVLPGLDLNLLDGTYTPRNRPIQDLVSFHEVGRKELGVDWKALLHDVCAVPVEDVQPHYMRCAKKRGRLGGLFPDAWEPGREGLLRRVMAKNRSHLKVWLQKVFRDMELTRSSSGWECRPELSRAAKGLRYGEMVELAEEAGFRQALWRIAERIAGVFDETRERSSFLSELKAKKGVSWDELTKRWRMKK